MTLEELFEKCVKISRAKREDYTSTSTASRNENFHRSAIIVSWFKRDMDKPYISLISTKIARLASLLSKEANPNFESIEDNFADIVNYFALWLEDISGGEISERDKKHDFNPSDLTFSFCKICGLHRSSHSIKE